MAPAYLVVNDISAQACGLNGKTTRVNEKATNVSSVAGKSPGFFKREVTLPYCWRRIFSILNILTELAYVQHVTVTRKKVAGMEVLFLSLL